MPNLIFSRFKSKFVITIFLSIEILCVPICAISKDTGSSFDTVHEQKINTELKAQAEKSLEETKSLIINTNKDLENQNKRLDDIWGTIGLLGYLAALLGVLTTISPD